VEISNLYKHHPRHYVSVDCIIFGFNGEDLKLLCIKRSFPPEMGKWSLMGGFLGENESIDEAAYRVLEELTGIKHVFLEQLQGYGSVNRDPAARVISLAYYALINPGEYKDAISPHFSAKWFTLGQVPELVFDHNEMVDKALRRLQRRCKTQPVGFELLADRFTLPQLQKLYESIFRMTYDKRNFRKKILSLGILQKLDEKEKETSKKGAYLYRFEKTKYDDLMKRGIHFEI